MSETIGLEVGQSSGDIGRSQVNRTLIEYTFIAIAFLAVFVIFTMFDTMERDQIYIEKGGPIHKKAVMYDKAAIDTTGVIPGDSIGVPPDETPVDDPGD